MWSLCLVHPKGNQPWIFIGKTDAKAAAPIIWPPNTNSWIIGKDWCGKDKRQEEKGITEDKMVGWHHPLNGSNFEQALGDGEGHGNLACCSTWGCRVRHNWATKQHHPHSWRRFQGGRLEIIRCCWDHLDWVCEWTQERPLYDLKFSDIKRQRSACLVAIHDEPPM